MSEIKPIPTKYNGVQFRSRLEARWAVFFDQLGVDWYYEYEGFQLTGEWYVPDFWLPNVYYRGGEHGSSQKGIWLEIKPESYLGTEHPQLKIVAEQKNGAGILIKGFSMDIHSPGVFDEAYEVYPIWDNYMMIYKCQCGIVKVEYWEGNYLRCASSQCHQKQDRDGTIRAYQLAKNFRFM